MPEADRCGNRRGPRSGERGRSRVDL